MKPNMYPCMCGEPHHFLWVDVDDWGTGIIVAMELGGSGDEASLWKRIKTAWSVMRRERWITSETEITIDNWKKLVVETDKAIKAQKRQKTVSVPSCWTDTQNPEFTTTTYPPNPGPYFYQTTTTTTTEAPKKKSKPRKAK